MLRRQDLSSRIFGFRFLLALSGQASKGEVGIAEDGEPRGP